LAASRDGADFTVRWPATNNAGFILLSGTNLSRSAAWSPLGGPYLLNGSSYEYCEPLIQSQAANFYRLLYVGVPATGPKLGCAPESNALALSWPTNFAGFNLETCTGLPPAGVWQMDNVDPHMLGTWNGDTETLRDVLRYVLDEPDADVPCMEGVTWATPQR